MPDTPSVQGHELTFSSFRLSETGLEPIGTPSFDDWLAAGEFINRSQRAVHFWIGDWLNYGEQAWGDRYTEALERTKYDYQTLRNDKWVASRIAPERRQAGLSFDHHQQVAELSPEEQSELLSEAVSQRLNNEKFRRFIRQREAPVTDHSLSGAPDKSPANELIDSILSLTRLMEKYRGAPFTTEEGNALLQHFNHLDDATRGFVLRMTTHEHATDTGH